MFTPVRHSAVRALATAAILAASATTWQAAAPGRVAATQTDLSFISSSTWTADPAASRVHVSVSLTATSHTIDTDTRSFFYDEIHLVLPPSATAYAATSSAGQPLSVGVESTSTSGVNVVVALGQRLHSGQSGSVNLGFDLVDIGGSTDRDLRLSHNLMSFPVWAFGSPGTPGSSTSVIFPPGFTVQEEFGGLTRAVFGSGEVVYSSGPIDDSTALNAWFTAVQPVPPGDFRVRTLTIGPLQVALRYWADDVGWADRVELILRQGYPVLRDLIGLGDPRGSALTVEEASTQEIGGFSGSYDPTNGDVQVSYFADPFVILHEAAHLWFNGDLASDRWIQEAFASYYAEQAVVKLNLVDHAPVLTPRLTQAAVPLNDWVTAGQPSSMTDSYLYGATLEVAKRIAALAGPDGLRRVWSAASSGRAAYQPSHATVGEVVTANAIDWRELLDLLESLTNANYGAIWSQWIVDPAQAPLLQQRATAQGAYAAAQGLAGDWDLPPDIRRALGDWQYDSALALIAQAKVVLAQRDQIVVAAAAEGTSPPDTLRALFEGSGVSAAAVEATTETAVLDALAGARLAESQGLGGARALGLLGTDPQADLAAARKAFASGDMVRATSLATSARSAWESAAGTGQARLFGASAILAGLALLLVVFFWARGGWRPRRSVAAAMAEPESGAEIPCEPATVAEGPPHGRARIPVGALPGAEGSLSTAGSPWQAPDRASSGGSDPEESAYDLLQRGHALLRDRHNAQAAVVLERAARAEPGKGSILEALGRAYFNSGQPARAVETFEALLEIDPSAHYCHFALGLSFARLGRAQEARTHLRLAVALDPSSATYRKALEKMESAGA